MAVQYLTACGRKSSYGYPLILGLIGLWRWVRGKQANHTAASIHDSISLGEVI